jgi:AraC family transcriptional regulator of adaptative response/methylated-DNA-[protein]-cysteine methyltransferase
MEDYNKIEKAITYLEKHHHEQPSLSEIAEHITLSPYHTQRLFKRWAGISPKQFLQYLTLEYAKTILENSGSLLDAAYEAGLSGTGRLHDLFITFDAVTPGEFKHQGEDTLIQYGAHSTPFGHCLIGVTSRGICWLSFYGAEGKERSLRELVQQWRGARFEESPGTTAAYAKTIFGHGVTPGQKPLTLYLKGTNFQIKVWEALLNLPEGGLFAYESLAAVIGKPNATRAVATAIGQNPVSYIIPCHRVLRKTGEVTGYRWGPARKKAIIAWEAAQVDHTEMNPEGC